MSNHNYSNYVMHCFSRVHQALQAFKESRIGTSFWSTLALSVAALLSLSTPAISATVSAGYSVVTYGADSTGASDSTTAIQIAANAAAGAHSTLSFPAGTYKVSKPIEVGSSVQMDASAVVRATVTMSAVIRVGSNAVVLDSSFSGGVIDANSLADEGIIFRQYRHIKVDNTTVLNAVTNGFHFGDATLSFQSYEAIVNGLHTRQAGTVVANSVGMYIDSNAVDGNYSQAVFTGSDIGVKTLTGGNFFTDIHVWSAPPMVSMSVGFDDLGNGNFWKGCEADSVTAYGMHLRKYNTMVQGCRFFNNNIYGSDAVAIGIYFDLATPFATVQGSGFYGQDATHRWAADMAGATSNLVVSGNQSSNVIKVYAPMTTATSANFATTPLAATASQNNTSSLALNSSWFDSRSGTTQSYAWNIATAQAGSGIPTTSDLVVRPAGSLPSSSQPRFVFGSNSATSSTTPVNSIQQIFQASYFNGAAQSDSWKIQNIVSSGSTPSSTLSFTHIGTSGPATIATPPLTINGDTIPMNSTPRLTWAPFGLCSTQTLNCQESSQWAPGRSISITQWAFNLATPSGNCSVFPVISIVQNGTILSSVRLTWGRTNYTATGFPINVSRTNGALYIAVTAAGSGCTTYGSGISNTLEYVMQ